MRFEPFHHLYQMIGRLKPGVTVEQTKSAVAVLGAQVEEAYPLARRSAGGKWGAIARTLDEARIDPTLRRSARRAF